MSKLNRITYISLLFAFFLGACSKDDTSQINYPKASSLIEPVDNTVIALDPDNNKSSTFSWSTLPEQNLSGQVKYNVLFDKDGNLFKNPLKVFSSDNGGSATTLTLAHADLDIVAGLAGIKGKKSGKVKWAVDAIVGSDTITTASGTITLNRPTSLGTVPTTLYLKGSATENGTIAFYKSAPGEFELITSLKAGTYAVSNSADAGATDYYYFNNELFRGSQPMTYEGSTKPVIIRVSFNNASGSVSVISSFDAIIVANGLTFATLNYAGNQQFSATNALVHFLKPGDPDAPSWLSWVEERYKFKVTTDSGTLIFGSYMDASMFGSLIPGLVPTDVRPDGAQPAYYFNVYTVDPDDYWAGCYKMASAVDGKEVNISVYFNSTAQYYHTIQLAN
jgi:hypothetical protein